jgi:thiamine-monophosphate kinase
MSLVEFGLIKKYFQKKHHSRSDIVLGSGDDCAVLAPPPGQELLMTIDTLLEGRHFLASMDPADLGYKAVAVSLSDIASMGGEPAWMLGALTMEEADEDWLERFSQGIFEILETYGVALVGGDFTRGPLTVSTQVTGFVPKGRAIRRSGAKVGDKIFVTGTLGDAGLALADQLAQVSLDSLSKSLVYPRLNRPTPRVAEGVALRSLATAAIDISDGLVADLGHLIKQSGVGAKVTVDNLPLSPTLKGLPPEQALALALSAGDDYELCFTLPPDQESAMRSLMPQETRITEIGQIVSGAAIEFIKNDGTLYQCPSRGYVHF